jgi:hypothetical protein
VKGICEDSKLCNNDWGARDGAMYSWRMCK